jgi:hypothetical protein
MGIPSRSGGIESCTGGGGFAAPDPPGALALAAAPTFAAMALWTALASGPSDMICTSSPGVFSLNGMTIMYALMSIFHVPPWVRLLRSRTGGRHVLDQRAGQ